MYCIICLVSLLLGLLSFYAFYFAVILERYSYQERVQRAATRPEE